MTPKDSRRTHKSHEPSFSPCSERLPLQSRGTLQLLFMSTDSQSSIFTWLAAVSSPQAVLFDTGLPLELPRPPVGPLLASTAQRKRRLSNSEADEENNYARPPKLPRGRERLTRHALRELQGKGAGVRKQQVSNQTVPSPSEY